MYDYILTYSKIKFYPLEPIKEDINIVDIAHALSLMTRANGHFKQFYSIAQHVINCCKEAQNRQYSKRVQLGCLLHDASESYISDITRPVKKSLSQYFAIEEKLQRIIYDKFGLGDLSEEELEQINEIDDALLYYEFEALTGEKVFNTVPKKTMEHDFSQRNFTKVENEFIYLFNKLTKGEKGLSCVGVCGTKEGWVAVNLTEEDFEIEIIKNIWGIVAKYSDSESIIFDLPIGLPECEIDISPDAEASKMLFSRSSSIFNTPCRQAVYEDDYHEANYFNKAIMGKSLSTELYSLFGRIKEIDELLAQVPQFKNKILESHPEVCFAMLNANGKHPHPIYGSRKTETGIIKRLSLLKHYYAQTSKVAEYIFNDPCLSNMVPEVIDALCLAVTGMIGIKDGFKTIPANPMKDSRGILMQIVYAIPDEL